MGEKVHICPFIAFAQQVAKSSNLVRRFVHNKQLMVRWLHNLLGKSFGG